MPIGAAPGSIVAAVSLFHVKQPKYHLQVPPFDWKPEGKPATEHSCQAIALLLTGAGKSITHVFGTPERDREPWVKERSGTDEVGMERT